MALVTKSVNPIHEIIHSSLSWLLYRGLMNFASSKVEGLEVGLSLSLKTIEGSPKLSLLDCGCYVNDVSIHLDGGSSWFYQGYVISCGSLTFEVYRSSLIFPHQMLNAYIIWISKFYMFHFLILNMLEAVSFCTLGFWFKGLSISFQQSISVF